jgi:hypothetical protein
MSDDEPTTTFNRTKKTEFDFTTLDRGTRKELVELTSTANPAAALIQVNDLELSALGANADLYGNWNPAAGSGITLTSWVDLGHGGRAVKSVTVRRGYLFPLGHRSIIVKTFIRALGVDPKNAGSDPHNYPVAYLQERTIVHVTEPVKSYPAVGQPFAETHGSTDWPFASVRMTTLTSPLIDSTHLKYLASGSKQAQWLTAGGDYLNWDFVATDLAGHDVHFSMPLVFVHGYDKGEHYTVNEFSDHTTQFVTAYNTSNHSHSTINGAKLRFAPDATGAHAAGQTTHPTLLIVLGAATTAHNENTSPSSFAANASEKHLTTTGQPNFYPTIKSARVRLHAAETLKGASFHDTRPKNDPLPNVGGVQISYWSDYVRYGAKTYGKPAKKPTRKDRGAAKVTAIPNPGWVYAQTRNPTPLNLPASTVGGLGTPNLGITGLSGSVGTVGGTLSHYAEHGKAALSSYFPTALSAANTAISQLLGGLNLGDILDDANFAMPTISSQVDPTSGIPTVTYTLRTPLTAGWPTSEPIFVPDSASDDGATPSFTMVATFTSPASGPPSYTVNGSIDPFTLYLVGQGGTFDFISMHFEALTFSSGSGSSPTVTVNLDTVQFDGVLEFVNLLEEFLSSLGGSGLSVDVQPTQVVVGTSLALPDLAVGMFSLGGISFNAGLTVPFIDGPAVATFSFATAANPFTLTVAMFGGGGFVALGLGYGAVHSVQAQFEFVGQFAFDITVANGSLSLVAGIYFSYTTPDTTAKTGGIVLTGFVRVTGQLEVLGIIMISAELDLSLTYASATGSVVGSATLRASVSICGFSKTVGITMTKQFAGSAGPATAHLAEGGDRHALEAGRFSLPTITWTDLMQPSDWDTYCAAFGA